MNKQSKDLASDVAGETLDGDRREALLKVARFGAYTAPALVVMLTGAAYAQADSLAPG